MNRYPLAALSCFALALGVVGFATMTAAMSHKDVEAIDKVREMEVQGVNSGYADSAVSVFADDVVFMPPGQPGVNGKDAARAVMASMFEQFDLSLEYTSAEVTVSGDWAVETYGGVATFSLKGGGDTLVEQIKGIHVYQRDDDGAWQITHDIWNADSEPAAME